MLKEKIIKAARRWWHYILSMPERTLRSLAALVGGGSSLLTETLLPDSLRGTTIYTVTVGMLQRFVVEQVAGMDGETPDGQAALSDDYVQRKMAGTALETAGLLTMGFSPLWVLAIAGDVAGGSKLFLNRLVDQLKENGVVAEEAEVADLVDVLTAVQDATSKSATAVDQPPLSREELSALANEMKADYGRVLGGTNDLIMPRLNGIWQQMEQLAKRENVSLERLGGIMTIDALRSQKPANAIRAVGKTGAGLFDEKILDSYRKTLAAASEEGVNKYIHNHMRPYLQSAKSHFSRSRTTWTEQRLKRDSK